MKLHLKKNKGFTIAELILVIAIIGVLTAIASNTYRNERGRFRFNNSLTEILAMC